MRARMPSVRILLNVQFAHGGGQFRAPIRQWLSTNCSRNRLYSFLHVLRAQIKNSYILVSSTRKKGCARKERLLDGVLLNLSIYLCDYVALRTSIVWPCSRLHLLCLPSAIWCRVCTSKACRLSQRGLFVASESFVDKQCRSFMDGGRVCQIVT